jgi:hypothetical protein
MAKKKKKKEEEKLDPLTPTRYYEIKPSWKEIFEDWIRFFAAYAVTVTILIILIKYG